jgi:hypothetical protein
MNMPTIRGSIRSINVFNNFACVKLLKTDDTVQFLLLWSYGAAQEDNAKNRLLHGTFLSLARDSFLNNRIASLSHTTGSSIVTSFLIE